MIETRSFRPTVYSGSLAASGCAGVFKTSAFSLSATPPIDLIGVFQHG